MVATPNGTAQVVCVIKNMIEGETKICELENGLKITPGHPIMYNGEWRYPREIVQPKVQGSTTVYNLVLDEHHMAIVNEVPVILLGHNYTEGILKHPYLGSQAVIRDLEMLPGWDQGFIEIKGAWMKKTRGIKSINMDLFNNQ